MTTLISRITPTSPIARNFDFANLRTFSLLRKETSIPRRLVTKTDVKRTAISGIIRATYCKAIPIEIMTSSRNVSVGTTNPSLQSLTLSKTLTDIAKEVTPRTKIIGKGEIWETSLTPEIVKING